MFTLSNAAKVKLKIMQYIRFWLYCPVILLITYKTRKSPNPVLKARVISKDKLGEHYANNIIMVNGLRIIPNLDVFRDASNTIKWMLDVDSNGFFILLANGKRINPYWPKKEK
jgi:hypothetical protein